MVIMAGMLPGVECARRRRLRQGGSSSAAAEAPCGTRRPSFCLHTGGHDHAHFGSSAASKERSGVRKEMMARAWSLDSNAREAKERLDQKLRGQRESADKRHQSAVTVRPPTAKPHATSTSGGSNNPPEAGATPAAPCVLQREVFSEPKNGGAGAPRRRRFSWSRLGRCGPPPPAAEAEASECAVCLEELRAGDVVAHLPCAHRFHWSCAVPWVRAASRCPVCRAQVQLAPSPTDRLAARWPAAGRSKAGDTTTPAVRGTPRPENTGGWQWQLASRAAPRRACVDVPAGCVPGSLAGKEACQTRQGQMAMLLVHGLCGGG